jgi:progressive ankylosis protein
MADRKLTYEGKGAEAHAAGLAIAGPTQAEPTRRQMLALWLPLAASIVMMVLEPSIINIGLGRTADPELALAAYGVAFSLALLVEAPILMLLDASVARSSDRESFYLLRRFTLWLGLPVTILGLVVAVTPLYWLIVEKWMNIPADVAAGARPTLLLLAFWPLPIAWRRTYQGVLIRAGRTASISVATGIRLATLSGALFVGLLLFPEQWAVVAGLAMDLSVIVEAALITWATRPILRAGLFQSAPSDAAKSPLTLRELWRFYRPLVVTTLLRQATRPLLSAGIAAAAMPRASLAAWPVAWGFVTLVGGPVWAVQQLTTALTTDDAAYRRVRAFSLTLGILFTLLLGLVVLTPLYGLVMGQVYNLSPLLQDLALPATQLMILYPLIMGIQSFLRGAMIRRGSTGAVRAATTADVLVLAVAIGIGVWFFSLTGVVIAALAVMAGLLVESAWLYWRGNG